MRKIRVAFNYSLQRRFNARRFLETACLTEEAGAVREAICFYEKAVALGSVEAMVNLGHHLCDDAAQKRVHARARRLYRSACSAGCAYGASSLSAEYRKQGQTAHASKWLRRAAFSGDAWALEELRGMES